MSYLKSVKIPKPCHETWQAMTPVNGGRHCQNCCKTVTDFTRMSNDEIIAYLLTNSHVCGRFNNQQMMGINDRLQLNNRDAVPGLKGWALLLAMLGPVAFYKASAQSKINIMQADTNKSLNSKPSRTIGEIVIVQHKTITGVITDEHGVPIPGVSVIVPQSYTGVATSASGRFTIAVPVKTTKLYLHSIGFKPDSIAVTADASQCYNIKLKEETNTLTGEVVTTKRPSFFRRIYYRYWLRPHRVIKRNLFGA